MSGRRARPSPFAGGPAVVLRQLLARGLSRAAAIAGSRDPVFVREAQRAGVDKARMRMPGRVDPRRT